MEAGASSTPALCKHLNVVPGCTDNCSASAGSGRNQCSVGEALSVISDYGYLAIAVKGDIFHHTHLWGHFVSLH